MLFVGAGSGSVSSGGGSSVVGSSVVGSSEELPLEAEFDIVTEPAACCSPPEPCDPVLPSPNR